MQVGKDEIRTVVVGILKDMIQDWGLDIEDDGIGPSTHVVRDLEFSSVDIIHLVVAIEEHFKKPKMGFDQLLMHDGRYVDDLGVDQIVDFVAEKLGGGAR